MKQQPIRFLFPPDALALPVEEFKARYVVPAMTELARKVVAKEPLTDVEQKIYAYFRAWTADEN